MKRPQGTPSTVSPVEFFEGHVYPAVFDHLDRVFPELGLVRKGRGWTATNAETTKARFGARPDRVVCNRAGGFLVHGGDAVSWLTYHRGGVKPTGADFVEAVKELAGLAGVDVSPLERELTPQEAVDLSAFCRRRDLLEDFADVTRRALVDQADTARAYLVGRGFTEDKLEGLPLGYYVGKGTVAGKLEAKGYSKAELDASGILADDRWEGRLVIHWRDARGRVATVAARDIDPPRKVGSASPKYLYLGGATKPPAFGLEKAARAEGLVLVEGLLDVVLLEARGLGNVAALGTANLSAEGWAALAALGFPSFTLALDNDEAGRVGTVKALENLRKVDKVRKVYVIPEGALGEAKDPDALVRSKGLEAFREVLKKARPWPLHLADHLLEGVTPEREDRAKSEAVDRVLNMAARPDVDQVREELVYRLASERTGYTVEGLKSVGLSVRERRERDEAEGELKAAAGELVDELGKPGADPFTLAAAFSKRFAVVRGRDDDTPPPFDPDALFDELATMPEGLLSGWKNVDAMDVRFRPQELAVLAARTGHGKTSALVHLLHAWLSADLAGPIVFYSHEEPCNSVNCRLLALLTCTENLTDGLGTSWTTDGVRKYGLNPSARQGDNATAALDRARARLRALKDRLVLVNKPRWSAERIAAHLHELAAEQKAGAVLVDYLQRLPFDGSADRRDIEVSKIAREMKSLAVDLSVPVVMGAQINREAIPKNYRDDITRALDGAEGVHGALKKMKAARPELHHLREGGSEQEADLVLGLMNYAADFHTDEDGKGGKGEDVLTNRFEVGVLKNRYGRTGRWAAMSFLPGRGLFTDLAARDKIGGQ